MSSGTSSENVQRAFPDFPPLDDETCRRIVNLLLILGMLFLLDIITTQVILRMGGVELNLFMGGIVANPALHLCIKAAIILVIFPVSLIAEQRVKGSGAVVYCIRIPLYILVFVNNMFVILPGLPV
jgi:hypothetical protein